jgi:hypothetical protein
MQGIRAKGCAIQESRSAETHNMQSQSVRRNESMTENVDTVVIEIEGQSFDLPAEFASTDELLVLALKPRFPNIGEPTIERSDNDGKTHITVIKRGGDKN